MHHSKTPHEHRSFAWMRYVAVTITVALFLALIGGWLYGRSTIERALTRAVGEALAPTFSVESVQVDSLTRLSLLDVRGNGLTIQGVRVHFSPWVALRRGALVAIDRIDLIEPMPAPSSEPEGELSTEFSLARLQQFVREFPEHVTGLSTYLESAPAHPGLSVRIFGARFNQVEDRAPVVDGLVAARPQGKGYNLSASLASRDGSFQGEVLAYVAPDAMRLERLALTSERGDVTLIESAEGAGVQGTVNLQKVRAASFEMEELHVSFTCVGQSFRCEGDAIGASGRIAHHPVTELSAHFTVNVDGGNVTHLEVKGAEGAEFNAEGDVAFVDETWKATVAIEGQNVPLKDGLRWVTSDSELLNAVNGDFAGSVRIRRADGRLGVTGEARMQAAYFADAAIDDGTVDFAIDEHASSISAELELGSGRVSVPEIVIGTDGVAGEISVDRVSAPAMARAARGVGLSWEYGNALGGRLSGTIELQGASAEQLEALIRVHSDRLTYRSTQLAPIAVDGAWSRHGGWSIDRFQVLDVRGSAKGESALDFELNAEWDEVTLEKVRTLVDAAPLEHLAGATSGRIHAQASSGRLSAQGRVDGTLVAGTSAVEIKSEAQLTWPTDFTWHGVMRSDEGSLTFDGVWRPDSQQRLAAELSEFPASALAAIARLPAAEGALTGAVEARAVGPGWAVQGDVTSPALHFDRFSLRSTTLKVDVGPRWETSPHCSGCLWGESSLNADMAVLDGGAQESGSLDVRLTFSGDEAVLDSLDLPIWGGWVTASGRASLKDREQWQLDFRSTGKGLHYQNDGLALDFEYDMNVKGPLDAPTATGSVRTTQGDIDLLRLPRGAAGARGGPMASVALDIEADVRNVSIFARSLFDAEVGGLLQIKGSLTNPAVYGEIEARRGMFRYGPTRFDVQEAKANFVGGRLVPRLNVVGVTRVDGHRVEARVDGPADDLTLNLLVDGQRDSQRALGLLGPRGASTVDDGGWRELGSALLSWLDDEFVSEAYWHLGRALERAFDLDRFRIEPDEHRDGMQLNMGKYVTPDLYLSYRRSLNDSGDDDVGLEYSIAPGVRFHTDWIAEEGPDVGLELRFPF